MALSDAQIFAAVLSILHIRNTNDVIEALSGLDDESFSRALDLHALITYRLDRDESREATERWMEAVDYDHWPEPTDEERRQLRMFEELRDRMEPDRGGVDIWDSVQEKIEKIEKGLLTQELFKYARRR